MWGNNCQFGCTFCIEVEDYNRYLWNLCGVEIHAAMYLGCNYYKVFSTCPRINQNYVYARCGNFSWILFQWDIAVSCCWWHIKKITVFHILYGLNPQSIIKRKISIQIIVSPPTYFTIIKLIIMLNIIPIHKAQSKVSAYNCKSERKSNRPLLHGAHARGS